MRKLNFIVLLILTLSLSVFSQITQEKTCVVKNEGKVLERETCAYVVFNKNDLSSFIKNDLSNLFSVVNVPLGISLAFEEFGNNENKRKFNPRSFVIKDLLNQITDTDSRYLWKETDGVINLFPKTDYSILETRIPEFIVNDEFPWKIDEKLVQTKEFQQYLKEKNLFDKIPDAENKYGFLITSPMGKPNPRDKISIDLKNATVREILNEVVRKRGHGTWTYQEYNLVSDGKFYQMYRLIL